MTPFILPVLLLLTAVFFIFGSCLALYAVWTRVTTVPLLIQTATALLLYFFPFTPAWLQLNFWIHRDARERLVSQLEREALQPGTRTVPAGFASTVKGDRLFVYLSEGKAELFFPTFVGILGHSSGFLFCPDDSPPTGDNLHEDVREVVKYAPRWYWIRMH